MSLMPFNPGVYTGTKVLNTSTHIDISGQTIDANCLTWKNSKSLWVANKGNIFPNIREYTTPIAYRVQSLEYNKTVSLDTSNFDNSTQSQKFSDGIAFGGFNFFIMANDNYIMRFSQTWVKEQELAISTDYGAKGSIRFRGSEGGTAGSLMFYQEYAKIHERSLSTAFDLTTAGSITTHDFTSSLDGLPAGFCFGSGGDKLHIATGGSGTRNIYTFALSTKYDPDTATLSKTTGYDAILGRDAVDIVEAETDHITLLGNRVLDKVIL